MISTKFFSTLIVTKLQIFRCGVKKDIMVYTYPMYIYK